jgi:enoyl-CoA hydratase/carnithine racemase
METRMPILAREAAKMGLVDDVAPGTPEAFEAEMIRRAEALAGSVEFDDHAGGEAGHPRGG